MNFDPVANWYSLLEHLAFGRALQYRRQEYIDEVKGANSVLILGDGDGRFTAEFLCLTAASRVDSVDLSFRMLSLAEKRVRRRVAGPVRVQFHHGDARRMEWGENYDLIVSHFFLDCFPPDEIDALIARISRGAHPQARWLLSEFNLPSSRPWRWIAALLIRTMYLFFRVFTGLKATRLPDYATSLTSQGFRRVRHRSAWGGFLISELWERP